MQWIQTALQFTADHSQLIAAVATILLACVHVARSTGSLRQGILALMLQAEKAQSKGELGGLTGERIMDLVVKFAMEQVVPTLPVYVRPFITEQTVRRAAYYAYADTKLFLESGRLVPLPAPSATVGPAPFIPPRPVITPAAQQPPAPTPEQPPVAS